MIPADVASRLRLLTHEEPAPPQPLTPAGKLTDVLSELVPGQRVMAEIQALLPNGTYRAVIAQRDITLALPFSAKTGDALELEVVESDGKLSLAFVANRTPAQESPKTADSVATTLSQTGKLIGNLLGGIDDQGKGSRATPLNGNQPLMAQFPLEAAELVPVLKEAIGKSGLFYEAHQARWVEGQLPMDALLQEPQGKFSSVPLPQASSSPTAPEPPINGPLPQNAEAEAKAKAEAEAEVMASIPTPHSPPAPSTAPASGDHTNILAKNHAPPDLAPPPTGGESAPGARSATPEPHIPSDLTPLVRQQLDALANQNYVWQGQIWPGQQIYWEIEEDGGHDRQAADDGNSRQWQTRLKLNLPGLGSIDVVMRLRGGTSIDLSLLTDSDDSRQILAAAGDTLRQQLDDAGLSLTAMTVQRGETPN